MKRINRRLGGVKTIMLKNVLELYIIVDKQVEQLADSRLNDDEDPFTSDINFRPGYADARDIRDGLEKLFAAAMGNGFPEDAMYELSDRLGLRKKDAKPFR
ncbi:unnamed protein product [Phytophthora fragariaefolia]|uniref:Unnamed protein product n=1 Tax=Phytophthora fragariaefolia TaxID=1490495 RepID=A0A9W6XE43_9STRA|nr:unnamed protein product [Phytophthora fragariaefolia]